jgi:predicted enzyme related to lactoylglutathione lyase
VLESNRAFNSFAVDNAQRAREFYSQTLGVEVEEVMPDIGLLMLRLPGGVETMVYEKPDFAPATYTVLNFEVQDVEAAVDELADSGVPTERYEGFGQDEKGISRGMGPTIAWFKDPAGNIIAVMEPGMPGQ